MKSQVKRTQKIDENLLCFSTYLEMKEYMVSRTTAYGWDIRSIKYKSVVAVGGRLYLYDDRAVGYDFVTSYFSMDAPTSRTQYKKVSWEIGNINTLFESKLGKGS